MRIYTLITSGLISLATINFANAQNLTEKLEKGFSTFSNHSSLKNGIASFHVIDSKTGNTVFEKNTNIGLPTASTLKTITSITALDLLGKDFNYKTKLLYTGDIDSIGILHGDIVIKGAGDPTLGSNRYESTKELVILTKWKNAIKEAGIDSIAGRIIADDQLYQGMNVPSGWPWEDMGNYYGAGISSLNWRENSTGLNFQASTVNAPAPITSFSSDISYLNIINQVKVGQKGTGDNVYAYSSPYSENILVKGTYALDLKKTIEISIPDPAYDLAYQLNEVLMQDSIYTSNGITTAQRLIDSGQPIASTGKVLNIHVSPALQDIVYWFNKKSINLYGEALLKSIAWISGGKTSTQEGAEYVKKYWQQKLKIDIGELDIVDGSGLSPQNNVTSKAMNQIMQYALHRPWFSSFLKSLPIYNQMTMKSGTINGTLGYTGYHTASNGNQYTFSLLIYNYKGTAAAMRQRMFILLDNLK